MGHLDDPKPPGGPQRDDAPSPGAGGGPAEPERHPEAVSSHDASDDEVDTHPDDRSLQQENAETSLDQPSQWELSMTDQVPEQEADEPTTGDAPDPEEFEPEGDASVSGETGTVYEGAGEPAQTPHDAALIEALTEELPEDASE